MKKFAIAGVQRSGTTLITTSLNSHPDIRCEGELFKMLPPRGTVDVKDSGYRTHLQTSFRLRVEDLLWRRRSVYRYLDQFYLAAGWKAAGFKLMRNQLFARRFPMVSDYLVERQVSVIHVIRENVLKVYLSRLGARRRRTFHSTQSQREPALFVPVTNLESELSAIEKQTAELRTFFEGSVPYLAITYEQYMANPEGEAQRMLEFLGVPAARLQSFLVKLNPDKLSELVENLNEVRQCLRDTRFEGFAVDPPGVP